MLHVDGLSCVRSDRLLFSDLSFSVSAAQVVVIEGRNGSGKTSLLRILCGLSQARSGSISFEGSSIAEEREKYLKNMLYLGHLPAIKSEISAQENLTIHCALSGKPALDIPAALAKVGLAGFEWVPCQYLSAGQKRRVALARLFAMQSRLWILDAPLPALDVEGVKMLETMITEQARSGGAVVMTTHQDVNLPQDVLVKRIRLARQHPSQ